MVFGVFDMISCYLIVFLVICKVSFIGLVFVGCYLMCLVLDGLKCVMMELGGYVFVLIFDDCDFEKMFDIVVL